MPLPVPPPSILAWEYALAPAVSWLLRYLVAPCLGPWSAPAAEGLLHVAFHALWLLPVYLVTMLVSCGMWVG